MRHYIYDEYIRNYQGKYVDVVDESDIPPHATIVVPPTLHAQVAILWDQDKSAWSYVEVAPTDPEQAKYMLEVFDYAKCRQLEYPPKEDYLDAIVKNDVAQQNAYVEACQAVKDKWPKTMVPVTRRDFLVASIGMVARPSF